MQKTYKRNSYTWKHTLFDTSLWFDFVLVTHLYLCIFYLTFGFLSYWYLKEFYVDSWVIFREENFVERAYGKTLRETSKKTFRKTLRKPSRNTLRKTLQKSSSLLRFVHAYNIINVDYDAFTQHFVRSVQMPPRPLLDRPRLITGPWFWICAPFWQPMKKIVTLSTHG